MNYPIYLDYAATTPVDKRVMSEMLPYFTEHFGNSSSRFHAFGWKAEEAVTKARTQVADLLGASPKEITFTGGATESINLAIKGVAEAASGAKNHIISLKTEHKAVLDTLKNLEKKGFDVTYLDIEPDGLLNIEKLESAIRPETLMISVMWVNNETGIIQDIRKIGELARQNGVLFHTDATQAIGKLKTDVNNLGVDLLSFSGHKTYGPKGVGVLCVRNNVKLIAQQDGGGHERSRRSGTLNITGIVGLGMACELAGAELQQESERMARFKTGFEDFLIKRFDFCMVNGAKQSRISGISNVCFKGFDGEELLMKMNQIAISNGSACNSASVDPSHVLKAMGLSDDDAYSSLRFSFGRFTTEQDIENLKKHVEETLSEI
jgi:cysteine desulfurase